MASYYKQVAVVAESIRCLGQETKQYEVCSPEFSLKFVFVLKTTLIAPEMQKSIFMNNNNNNNNMKFLPVLLLCLNDMHEIKQVELECDHTLQQKALEPA